MFDKLETVEARYEELTKLISDPEVIANQTEWQKLIKEHSSIEEIVQKYREYKKEKQRMDEAKEMQKKSEITEDDLKNEENEIQKLTDKKVEEIDSMLASKEREVMSI